MAETLYNGLAHEAIFYLPVAGIVRFAFGSPVAGGYVRSGDGALMRVQPDARLFLSVGRHVLTLYDPSLMTRVSIVFIPD